MAWSSATTSCIARYDSEKNPTLARILNDSTLPDYEQGTHFSVVQLESGSQRCDLPIFTTVLGAVELDADTERGPVSHMKAEGVPGGFVIKDVLTPRECDRLVKLAETMGYTEDAPVSLARHIRQNENCVWIADTELCNAIFERCRPHFPTEVQGGQVCGLNARWRLYKYNPDDVFRVHTDGSWPGSGIDADGRLVQDIFRDRWSQLTIVFYLNDDFEGGSTRFFYPISASGKECRVAEVPAERGSAVCFFHGEHPQSPLHEGGLVTSGTKYIIRSDVLYRLPGR
eukprot:TRINITY_DN58160_c0_g1_i1.p1 TRINITY_DN58160_c0_g1~~TRINITY_DN58160_c0_g1_i1.p1  ORF type:complete len:285 (+),score=34.24 TRINITY_DN58160_c0_g1_i1:264-1118(+)